MEITETQQTDSNLNLFMNPKTQGTESEKAQEKNNEENDFLTSVSYSKTDSNNRIIKVLDNALQFKVQKSITEDGNIENKVVVNVINEQTGKVIRQVPHDELKNNLKKLSSLVGMVYDNKG